MNDRLPTDLVVAALLRRVNDAGGLAMVLAKGDLKDGALLFITFEKARFSGIFQREPGPDGQHALVRTGPGNDAAPQAITDFWQRRRQVDPDLWVIELDIASAERFAAETVLAR